MKTISYFDWLESQGRLPKVEEDLAPGFHPYEDMDADDLIADDADSRPKSFYGNEPPVEHDENEFAQALRRRRY